MGYWQRMQALCLFGLVVVLLIAGWKSIFP